MEEVMKHFAEIDKQGNTIVLIIQEQDIVKTFIPDYPLNGWTD